MSDEAESDAWRLEAEVAINHACDVSARLAKIGATVRTLLPLFDGAENLTGSQAAAIDALRRRVKEVVE